MAKITKHIEIVASTVSGLTSMGAKSRAAIQAILSEHYVRVDVTIVNNLADLNALVERQPDLVFLGMKFIPNNPELGYADTNKIWLSEYLAQYSIPYTGSGKRAIELELHKELSKQHLLDAGLKTASFCVVRAGDALPDATTLPTYPLFVKPTNRGGGLGVDAGSLVYTAAQLQAKVHALATRFGSDALIETYLPGREFSVGILRQAHTGQYLVLPLELIAPPNESGARFLSGSIKVADTEQSLALEAGELRTSVNQLAIAAFHALGAWDYGRIDIRLDGDGVPHFLEANLLPSLLAGYGNFPKACLLNEDVGQEAMILNIVNLAFRRHLVPDVEFDDALNTAELDQATFLRPILDTF